MIRRSIARPARWDACLRRQALRSARAGTSGSWRRLRAALVKSGGRVFGIVMNQFKSEPNRYLTDKVATNHFYDRLQNLITRSVGFVAFKGGMGTVTEVSLVWNKLQTRVLERRPIVLIGDCWKGVVAAWQENLVVSADDVSLLSFADDAEQACRIIVEKSQGVVV